MAAIFSTITNLFNLAFEIIPDSLLMLAIPFLGALFIVKGVKHL